jgi:ADP-ribosylglycohydrolase
MALPTDYTERVYAGVLGKIIGVYLGRPFEGWSYDKIMAELGEITYYVHERLGAPLIVTDDDISGTFTFFRALADNGHRRDLSPAQIGQTWLNYLIEKRTVLWWGGMGTSTEHTAYLRLKHGIAAPFSGSIVTNGRLVAEQIGAQIFIDAWGMAAPGDPALAADLARRAASVSHDGEAIYGAQVVAAIEAAAFVESDIQKLLDTALAFIPADSIIARMIADIREWHNAESDWRKTRAKIAHAYGYHKYGGGCHMVPNHALIIHALLHGEGDFSKSLTIVNTCGWDTDCNSGNVGCILGIRNGLSGIEDGPDWRGPVADRMYLPTADGGRGITDAVAETYQIVNAARALQGVEAEVPKGGARFHFELPGSTQGFVADDEAETRGTLRVENVLGNSRRGQRSLALRYTQVSAGRPARVGTGTFMSPEAAKKTWYSLVCSPTLYPGQVLRAGIAADAANTRPVDCRLYIKTYDEHDKLSLAYGPERQMEPGDAHEFRWRLPEIGGYPIAEVGVEIRSESRADGALYLDFLTWDGPPDAILGHTKGSVWKRAWVDAMDHFETGGDPFRLIQDEGTGMVIQGTREWTDYRVTASLRPHMAAAFGLAARVQGLRRYYALTVSDANRLTLSKMVNTETVLARCTIDWSPGKEIELCLQVEGSRIRAEVDGETVFDEDDSDEPLTGGGIGLLCKEGRIAVAAVHVGAVN